MGPPLPPFMKTLSQATPRFLISLFLVAVSLSGMPSSLRAQSIGVNLGGTSNGTLGPGDVAGVSPYAQSNYNNVSAAATNLILNDNTGAATTAMLTTTGANSFSIFTGNAIAGPDEILNNSRANSTGTSWSFTLSGIPYGSYLIIVYDLQFATSAVVGISAGGTTYYTSSPTYNAPGYIDGNAATPFTYTQGTSTNPLAPTPMSDYVLFSGLTGSSVTVTITGGANATRISGFQIVQTIPEPSTWAMLLLGGAGLLAGARRSFRRA